MMRTGTWITLIAVFTAAGAWAEGPAAKTEEEAVRTAAKTDKAVGEKAEPAKPEVKAEPGKPKAPAKPAKPARVRLKTQVKVRQQKTVQVAHAPKGGWLGIRMGAVPEGLATHLKLKKDAGVIVRNVVVGGPADKAGLERYDIILRVDGKDVDLGTLGGKIRARKPGEKIALDLIHEGQRKKAQIVLGKPIPVADAKLKYEAQPQTIWQDRMKWQGGVLRRGPKGWEPFWWRGPTADVDRLLRSLPRFGDWEMELELGAGEGISSWTIRRTTDGKTVEVQRHKDGRITVKRSETAPDGSTKRLAKTYKNADALREADPGAYAIYKEMKGPSIRMWTVPRLRFDPERWKQWQDFWREQSEKRQKAVQEHLERYQKDAKERAEQMKKELERQDQAAKERAERWRKHLDSAMKNMPKYEQPWSPKQFEEMMRKVFGSGFGAAGSLREFKVAADGSIEVHVREGDNDLTLKVKNEKELKAKHPKLYEQYQKLLKSVK